MSTVRPGKLVSSTSLGSAIHVARLSEMTMASGKPDVDQAGLLRLRGSAWQVVSSCT